MIEKYREELTQKQKDWIKARDDHASMFPERWDENSYKPTRRLGILHVHHIIPQGWGIRRLGMTASEINHPYNLITLSEYEHIDIIHAQDVPNAKKAYRGDKDAFFKMFERRRSLVDRGIKYWLDTYDEIFLRIAKSRTDRYEAAGNVFPTKRTRRVNI